MKGISMKLLRVGLLVSFVILSSGAFASVEWLGVYLQGQKIGYSYSKTEKADLAGKKVDLTLSKMEIGTQMLGSSMRIVVDSSVWIDGGRLVQSYFKMTSGGRTLSVNARYSATQVIASLITESGEEQKVIEIPVGKRILTDPMELVEAGIFPAVGKPIDALIFSPETMELVSIQVVNKGIEELETKAGKVKAQVVFVDDPRSPSTIYLSAKGDLIKMTGALGIEMIPETEKEAKEFTGEARIDLAAASRVTPDKMVFWDDKKVELEFSGIDLSKVPSDARQQVKKSGEGWLVTLSLDREANAKTSITDSSKAKADWTKPDTRVPSDDPEMMKLAKKIVGNEKTVVAAAHKIHEYVFSEMGVNAGIGVMRDAREILKTKEGVCRDHAILAGTLLRAAGIPTRFANGLVLYNGSYYYHAWVEFWDGDGWIGMDTTRPALRLGSGYLKTSQGTVGQALQGFLLDGAKIKVIGH
ncbi:MAG: transglutaminase-like domain-containing protein [Fimbriimonadaceae bacterium]